MALAHSSKGLSRFKLAVSLFLNPLFVTGLQNADEVVAAVPVFRKLLVLPF
jgi:hypothetical protein